MVWTCVPVLPSTLFPGHRDSQNPLWSSLQYTFSEPRVSKRPKTEYKRAAGLYQKVVLLRKPLSQLGSLSPMEGGCQPKYRPDTDGTVSADEFILELSHPHSSLEGTFASLPWGGPYICIVITCITVTPEPLTSLRLITSRTQWVLPDARLDSCPLAGLLTLRVGSLYSVSPVYEMTLIFPAWDAAHLHFCFEGALESLDEIHCSDTISLSSVILFLLHLFLYSKMFGLWRRGASVIKTSSGYLNDPLNFHALCIGGDYFYLLLCASRMRTTFQGFPEN